MRFDKRWPLCRHDTPTTGWRSGHRLAHGEVDRPTSPPPTGCRPTTSPDDARWLGPPLAYMSSLTKERETGRESEHGQHASRIEDVAVVEGVAAHQQYR